MSRNQPFLNIRTEGALLPPDLLARLLEGANLTGLRAEDYQLGAGEKLNEAISRSWTRLLGLWAGFRRSRAAIAATDLGTTLTREKWLLQLFGELDYGRLLVSGALEIDGKSYPITHFYRGQHYQVPVHLVSFRADLDKRSEQKIVGASKASPHGLMQEFLNRSEDHLWAFVSNGLKLRVLRDNASLTRQAHVEFDLEGIFEGESYADFRLLWLVCHRTRVEGTTKNRPETCWLETWSKLAQTDGRRALDQLRDGVEQALSDLGTGFISHKANQGLRDRLKAGELRKEDLYRQLLRLAYRLIFLFVAEDRDLLHAPDAPEEARARYAKYYSGQRLRRLAERTRGGRHSDLWVGLRLVFAGLGNDKGCPELGLPALGGFLFSQDGLPDLDGSDLANEHLLQAIRHLGLVRDQSGWRLVDYRNLGSEELGSIYESLLELTPTMELDAGVFKLAVVGGNQRKTTGSYYTPDSLIQCLLDSALDPVLNEAAAKAEPEQAILDLKVCEPACGSGHFLIAAAHRIARKLASVRTGEEAPSPESVRTAVRDVIGHCLFGVDLNPMAVELCKVNLWLEAIEPGKPLSFLDAHIQCGNSLLGTTPALMAAGIPDDAFSVLEGDDRAVVTALKRQNRQERTAAQKRGRGHATHTGLFSSLGQSTAGTLDLLNQSMSRLEAASDSDIRGIQAKESQYKALQISPEWSRAKLQADAWCAAFVWEKTTATAQDVAGAAPLTHASFEQLLHSPDRLTPAAVEKIQSLSEAYAFLHWHVAFPQVFRKGGSSQGWVGGFDVVLGNPPWERIKLQEKEWFASRDETIANAQNSAQRKRQIEALATSNPSLYKGWHLALRKADGETGLVRNSGRFPLCGIGDINTYSVFAETMRSVLTPLGQAGIVVPSGIATDDTTKFFFQDLMRSGSLQRLYDFENREKIFPAVDSRMKFSLVTMGGPERRATSGTDFAFFLLNVEDLEDSDKHFTLTAEDLSLLSPNTGTCATFRSKTDAELTKAIYRRVPVLIVEANDEVDPPRAEVNPWALKFQSMFHMANDSVLFQTRTNLLSQGWRPDGNVFRKGGEAYLPLYEAKMLHHFDHRFATYVSDDETRDLDQAEREDPSVQIQPRYWVPELEVFLKAADIPTRLRKALSSQDAKAVLVALGEWILGASLESSGSTQEPKLQSNAQSLWQGLQHSQHWLRSLDLSEMELGRALEAATTCPWSQQDEELLGAASNSQEAAMALLEHRTPKWFMGWRDICRSTDERTVIASALPRSGVGHKFPMFRSEIQDETLLSCLQANLCSFVLDYVARQKVGGTSLTYFYIKQFPVLIPEEYSKNFNSDSRGTISDWIAHRVTELLHSAWDTRPIAKAFGVDSDPFAWDQSRRFYIRCELDAAFFHLYALSRDEVAYVMDTFPIVRRKDESAHGTYRTKDTILSIYDAMADAIRTGQPYQTILKPPPADPSCCHPPIEN